MLESDGVRTLRFALMAISDPSDPVPLERWVRTLAGGGFDDVIFMSAEGVTRVVAVAERLGLRSDLLGSLAGVRKVTRGPKPARVLRDLGLAVEIASAAPTAQGVMSSLRLAPMAHHRVGLQTLGDDESYELVTLLEAKGARVHAVAPYRYRTADDSTVEAMLDVLGRNGLDALTFTSITQVERLFEVATRGGRESQLRGALARCYVAALGTSVVARLRAHHVRVDAAPSARRLFMRRLARAIMAGIGAAGPDADHPDHQRLTGKRQDASA
jgi:uroporphyrinogen-III synthase